LYGFCCWPWRARVERASAPRRPSLPMRASIGVATRTWFGGEMSTGSIRHRRGCAVYPEEACVVSSFWFWGLGWERLPFPVRPLRSSFRRRRGRRPARRVRCGIRGRPSIAAPTSLCEAFMPRLAASRSVVILEYSSQKAGLRAALDLSVLGRKRHLQPWQQRTAERFLARLSSHSPEELHHR
jgi:hypothetical protein